MKKSTKEVIIKTILLLKRMVDIFEEMDKQGLEKISFGLIKKELESIISQLKREKKIIDYVQDQLEKMEKDTHTWKLKKIVNHLIQKWGPIDNN